MIRLLVFLAAAAVLGIYLAEIYKKRKSPGPQETRKLIKTDPRDLWAQVFETRERDEAARIKARLEEGDIRVIVFEQAKKDLDGKTPPGIGLAVPKPDLERAQSQICRYLETS
jgi:hypothetical protein